jgi:DNA (cytosine-5)-methyltransferase 1
MQLILETFTGIGLLGIGFKEAGFCVVSAGDIILGNHHDIHNFHAPHGKFDGVIGGSPCQNFSKLNRNPKPEIGIALMNEFKRVVLESGCSWFLLENVPESPDIEIDGYAVQRFMLNAKHCGSNQNRNRKFQFGSRDGLFLQIKRDSSPVNVQSCITASEGKKQDRRTVEDFCELQGLPRNFDLPDFNKEGFYRAVGNGVNVNVSRKIAFAIRDATEGENTRTITEFKFCVCGCGETVTGKQLSKTPACRKRIQKKREHTRSNEPRGITFEP